MKLKNWTIEYNGGKPLCAWGNVYGNPKFEDGKFIVTSKIFEYDELNGIVKTKNSTYELEDK